MATNKTKQTTVGTMANDILATSTQQRGKKRPFIPEPSEPMMTRKRSALIKSSEQSTALATGTTLSQHQVKSSNSVATVKYPPSPPSSDSSQTLNSQTPSESPPDSSLESTSPPNNTICSSPPVLTTNSTAICTTQGQKRKYVPEPNTAMTRKRAALIKPEESATTTSTDTTTHNVDTTPSSSTSVTNQSPSKSEIKARRPLVKQSKSRRPIIATKSKDSVTTPKTKNKGKGKAAADDKSRALAVSMMERYTAELTRMRQSKSVETSIIVNEKSPHDTKDLHPGILEMMQVIEKKKENGIKLATARYDAKRRAHMAEYDAVVHQANMDFEASPFPTLCLTEKVRDARKQIYQRIYRQRRQLIHDHHHGATRDVPRFQPARQPQKEGPPVRASHRITPTDLWEGPSSQGLTEQEIDDDFAAIWANTNYEEN